MTKSDKIEIENVNSPGRTVRVDKTKYEVMRDAMLKIIPANEPGLTAKEIKEELIPVVPDELWPNGEKIGWWQKAIQLDLEAKGILNRDPKSKPLRWWREPGKGKS
ncbi:DUF6958 family protein [Kineobactrum salinum]|uniref:Uncharacterized protein n=1 Tax=Kineobactrum salinum TaxID=2708301 RepID=A0A6C0U412_9GAMM|nr:hypothetical protein [Kineobactrum salinum]QIB66882.1 hypothetical protein G3T16_17290 [Kineobactrum salinum]